MLNLNTTFRSDSPASQPVDTQTKIEKLVQTMEAVRKQLRELHKQLDDATDRLERMRIRHRITELEDMLDSLRQQIVMLSQMEERRKHLHHAAQEEQAPPSTQAAPAVPPVDSGQ